MRKVGPEPHRKAPPGLETNRASWVQVVLS